MLKNILFIVIYLSAFVQLFSINEDFIIYLNKNPQIVIDGDNKDWPDLIPFFLESDSQITDGKRTRYEDFNGKIWCMFDETNIYLYAEVADKTPLKNKYLFTKYIWDGDSIETQISFRKQNYKKHITENDFLYSIGFNNNKIDSKLFQIKLLKIIEKDTSVIKQTEIGYNFECKIPLTNFKQKKVKNNDIVYLEFGINNVINKRHIQLRTSQDNYSWGKISNWPRIKLVDDINKLNKVSIRFPKTNYNNQLIRCHIWKNRKPWNGEIDVDNKIYKTDPEGGINLYFKENGFKEISVLIDGEVNKTKLFIQKKTKSRFHTVLKMLLRLLSVFFTLFIVTGAFLIYYFNFQYKKNKKIS